MRRHVGLRVARVAIIAFACSASALGQGADARFGELVKKATDAYGAGNLEESIALLREAYAIKPDPRLLYNIAKSNEGLGRWQEAIDGYRAYLERAPQADNRDVVAGRITVLEKQILERKNQQAMSARLAGERAEAAGRRTKAISSYQLYLKLAPNAEDAASIRARIAELERPRAAQPDNPDHDATPKSTTAGIAPWLVVGVGSAALGTGVAFAILSRGKYDDARQAGTGTAADDARQTGDTFTTVANVSLIAGGVVLAGGVTWVLIGGGNSGSKPRAALSIQPNGLALSGTL